MLMHPLGYKLVLKLPSLHVQNVKILILATLENLQEDTLDVRENDTLDVLIVKHYLFW